MLFKMIKENDIRIKIKKKKVETKVCNEVF